jgi:4-amino-4-deoxy-L-arabinose transferase-like glycosyltransferase
MNKTKPWIWLAAAALIAVQVALVAVIVHGESLTIDEGDHIYAGYMMWHTKDFGLNPEHPPLVKLVATLPLVGRSLWLPPMQNRMFKIEAYFNGRDFLEHDDLPGQRLIFQVRLVAGVFAIGLSLFVFLAGLDWFGPGAALVALALVVFEPNFLANSDLVTTDVGVACFLIGSLWCFWRYARRPTFGRMLLAGLVAGCALAAKHNAILLGPMLLVVALAEVFWAERGRRWSTAAIMAGGLVIIGAVAVGVLWATYGFRYAARPAGLAMIPTLAEYSAGLHGFDLWIIQHLAPWRLLPESYLMGLTDVRYAEQGVPAFILGRHYAHGLWWYFPVALTIKSTLGLMALVALAAGVVVTGRLKPLRGVAYVVLPGLVYLGIAMHATLNIGTRHVLVLYALAALLAGAGAWELIQRNRRWAFVIGVLVGLHVVSAMAAFPSEMAYSNEAWGGPSNTHKYLSDANVEWGQQLLDVKKWVDAHPNEECWLAYVCFPLLRPEGYGINCHHLPTADTGFMGPATDAPEVIKGALLVSGDDLEACEWPSNRLNPYRRLRSVPMSEQIEHGMFVYRGEFHLPEVAALSASQRAQLLLGENKPAEALAAAQAAVRFEPGSVLSQTALGDAAAALGQKDVARTAYQAAIAAAHELEADVQPEFVPGLEDKLKKLDSGGR